jgi:peptide/nickel transport system ATP-binding protein
MSTLLQVEDLSIAFPRSGAAPAPVVRDVSFSLKSGRALAIVGESGSGKSVIARSLVGLSGDSAAVSAARLEVLGRDARSHTQRDWRALRGKDVGFVLQDALVSLDPLRRVGDELEEALIVHGVRGRSERRRRVLGALSAAGVPEPELRMRQRAGELSGGLRQRALIAQALVLGPRIIIADEPTTALDATVQAQIVELLRDLKGRGHGLIVISHDLAVVASIADDVLVLRQGEVVEYGPAVDVLTDPQHPYTRQLIDAVPTAAAKGRRLSDSGATGDEPAVARRATDAASGIAPALQATVLCKSYRGPYCVTPQVVRDVSFTLRYGTHLGIVGESGSG